MLNKYEREVMEVLLTIFTQSDQAIGHVYEVIIGQKSYLVECLSNTEVSLAWPEDEYSSEGLVIVRNWQENWVKTAELFAMAIRLSFEE